MANDPTRDREKLQKQIDAIAQKIVSECDPEKIILFGSAAKGSFTEDSDFDLFVVQKTNEPRRHRAFQVRKLFLPRDFALDVLVYTPEEVEESLQDNFFIRQIFDEGKVLYEKPAT